MSVITGLEADPKREGRIVVMVNGGAHAVITLSAVTRLDLRVGAPVDDALSAALADADADCALYDKAMRLLSARSRSANDLRRRLRQAGAEVVRIERVIQSLAARGFVDDAAHARTVTRSRVRSRGASSRRIAQELRRQGVAADVVSEAIDEVFADESIDEAAVAMEVARKRAAQLADLPAPVQRRRLYGYLARRGYGPDVVRAAVDAVLK